MKRLAFIFVLVLSCCYSSFGCLNGETKILKDGTYLYEDDEGMVPYGHNFFDAQFVEALNKLDSFYKVTGDLDYLSDKGLVLILLKGYDEAISLYLDIEKQQPDRYSTASNIGTAYELAGQNENALKWIKKAVQLDSSSHLNSEWIHVNILRAKIGGEKFYTSKMLLNTDFGTEKNPSTTLNKKELLKLYNELFFQLNERVSFVKPKNKLVAQLMFDLGNIAFLSKRYAIASIDYGRAKDYGYSGKLIEGRIKEADRRKEIMPDHSSATTSSKRREMWPFVLAGFIILVLGVFSIVFLRRRNKRRSI